MLVSAIYTFYTDSCLGPGETGHFTGLQSGDTTTPNMYAQVENVVYNTVTGDSSANSALDVTITPQSYASSAPTAGYQTINLSVKNTSLQTGRVFSSLFLLLDDADEPLMWEYFTGMYGWSGVLMMDQTGTLTGFSSYDGVSHKILPYLDYQEETTPLMSNVTDIYVRDDFATLEQYTQYLLNLRNQKLTLMRSYAVLP